MNQPDRRSTEFLLGSTPILNKQRDSSRIMEDASGFGDRADSILKFVLQNANSTHPETLLSDLAHNIGDLFAANACLVVSSLAVSGTVNQIGYWNRDNRTALPDKIIQQLSVLSLASHHSVRSAVIEQPSSLYDLAENLVQQILPNSTWMGITTQFQHQINGMVILLNQSRWTHSQPELLKNNSDRMAIAISQIQLQQEVHTKTRYQTLLKNISREIGHGDRPEILFRNCLTSVCTALQLDGGSILMLKYRNPLRARGRGNHLVKGTAEVACQWTRDSGIVPEPKISFSLTDSKLCQQAWQNAPNTLCFTEETPFPDLKENELGKGSALAIAPLMGKKTSETDSAMVLGFLVLQHDSWRYWSADELDLLDWLAVQVSTAIIHHQTLNQVQSIVDERTAQLKSSLDVREKLSRKMRQHIEQLQKLNQLKDDFMNSMSHELKTPLTSMKMAIKMLRQAEISPEMREKYLDILEQEWNREYSLIKDLLTLQQVESGELDYSPQQLDLDRTFNKLSQLFVEKWQFDKEIELEIDLQPGLKIYTDAESLEYILSELLSNAGKYSDPSTKIELAVYGQGTGKDRQIAIAVANIGVGITPDELPYIFDKFRRGKGVTDRAVPGTGLGLALVQYLVEHLNGTIEVTSEPIASNSTAFLTTFVLKLPQIQPSIG